MKGLYLSYAIYIVFKPYTWKNGIYYRRQQLVTLVIVTILWRKAYYFDQLIQHHQVKLCLKFNYKCKNVILNFYKLYLFNERHTSSAQNRSIYKLDNSTLTHCHNFQQSCKQAKKCKFWSAQLTKSSDKNWA